MSIYCITHSHVLFITIDEDEASSFSIAKDSIHDRAGNTLSNTVTTTMEYSISNLLFLFRTWI